MKRLLRGSATYLSLLSLCLGICMPTALAATAPSATGPNAGTGQALEIAPPLITLNVNPGQTIHTQLNLRDVSSGNLVVTAQVNDFVAAGEDGTPKILLDTTQASPFSLKDWVSPIPQMLMKPREIRNLPITFNIPANASPGGHYGVIRFSAVPPELKGTGVSLSASLGALVLMTVSGNIKDQISIQEFSASKGGKTSSLFESAPINFEERLKNTGNSLEQPAGQVTVTDMFGKKIATVNVNLPPRYILPDSTRKFSQPLDSSVIGNKKLFGRYHATLNLKYGAGNKQTLTSSLSFWVIPYRLMGAIIVILIVGFFALRYFIRGYNERIITRAQNRRRR